MDGRIEENGRMSASNHKPEASSSLVYSTEAGRMCPECRQPLAACICKTQAALAAAAKGDGVARVSREKQGRGGKTVTVVRGLPLLPDDLAALGKRLRTACGAGGTCKEGVLEVQGDHAERVVVWLNAQGHKAKRSGG
jgi:translation initiation factor 1